MIGARAALAIPALLACLACSDNAIAPKAPEMPSAALVSLSTPNTDDGAIVVTLTGPHLSTLQPASTAYVLYSRVVGPSEVKIIVIGKVVAGPLFTVAFGTGQYLSAYAASVEQVAARNDSLRASVAAYGLTLSAALD